MCPSRLITLNVLLPTDQRLAGTSRRSFLKKEPKKLGPPDLTVPPRPEGTTVQECGDSSVVGNGSTATTRCGKNSGKELGVFEELFIHGGRWKLPTQRTKIGDYAKHIFSEHNQEANHPASLGAGGTRKITVEKEATTRGGRQCENSGAVEKKRTVSVASEL